MKKLNVIIAILGICTMGLNAQDMFKARQLTFNPAQEGFPTWSPDGEKIAFTRNFDIWIMDLNIEQVKKDLQHNTPQKHK